MTSQAPAIQPLLELMARLRDPRTGCPWDRAQDFRSIAPYTIEEAYEVADAVEQDDPAALRDELGDLLFQVAFHARMAEEAGSFDFGDVVSAVVAKMRRRHPHVFADAVVTSVEQQTTAWEAHKAAERDAKAGDSVASRMDRITPGLPALVRARKLQKRAARVGFDWDAIDGVFDKVAEELDELRAELHTDPDPERVAAELGDLLFSCVNLARHAGVDAEAALRGANRRFERRFRAMEQSFSERGQSLEQAEPAAMDAAWEAVKSLESKG